MGMFTNAAVVEEKKTPAKAKKKDVVQTEGLHYYGALCAVKKATEANIGVVGASIKSEMMGRFIEEGIRIKRKPESYKGEENGTTASLEFRCRGTNSPLSEEERALLDENEIKYDEQVAREETFIINPDYADLSDPKNAEMLAKVEEALSSIGLPANFIMRQQKLSKHVVTDETIEQVFSLTTTEVVTEGKKKVTKNVPDRARIAALVPMVAVLGIKPTLAADVDPFLVVDEILNPKPEAEEGEGETAQAAA